MDKFLGKVNGKSYTNKDDFHKAIDDALKDHSTSSISVSFCEKSYDDGEDKQEVSKATSEPEVSNEVNQDEYVLKCDQKPDVNFNKDFFYGVKDELIEKLKNATNKIEIRQKVNDCIEYLIKSVKAKENSIDSLLKEIEEDQVKLEKRENELKILKSRKAYYDYILKVVNKWDKKPVEKETNNTYSKKVYEKPLSWMNNDMKKEVSEKLLQVASVCTDLHSFLKELGFIPKKPNK